MVTLTIDGKQIQARDGAMVIEAADEAGIYIPRFCYHKKLSVAANCRMCLVEIEKARKPLPACATPVTDGMVVQTRSPNAIAAQKGVMEFLLVNHPLDCPICDQGGECELQDIAMGYGRGISRFTERKRVVQDKNLGPLIATDMTRCIHCTRCVRFGEEVAGIKELGATGRGEHMRIGTYIENTVDSELSGNVIDLCPVGALTSKPFRFSARAWELKQRDTVAPHDSVGSNLHVHIRRNEVMRVAPKENEAINETWISDRDRFSYEGLYSDERVTAPLIKEGSEWRETDWETALAFAVNGVKKVISENGAQQLGVLASPGATLEELYLLQKMARGMGGANIDHRLRQVDFSDQEQAPVAPWLGQSIQDLDTVGAALLIGANTRKDQPIVGHRLRKAALGGARISFINPLDYEFRFPVANKIIAGATGMVHGLAGVAKALLNISGAKAPEGLAGLLNDIQVSDTHTAIANDLFKAERATVLLGNQALSHPALATLRQLAGVITGLTDARLGYLPPAANSVGAAMAGVLPHRGAGAKSVAAGLDAQAMLAAKLKAYILLGLEPELDCADPATALAAVNDADFVVAMSTFRSPAMQAYADVILPTAPFTETSGTYVNAEGRWQSFSGVVTASGETRPGWKVLRVMGNLFGLDGFDYVSSEEVREECRSAIGGYRLENKVSWQNPAALGKVDEGLTRVADVPIYAIDSLVRRAPSLQHTRDAIDAAVYLNGASAAKAGLGDGQQAIVRQGSATAVLPVMIDERVPDGCVYIPAGLPGCATLGTAYGSVGLERAS